MKSGCEYCESFWHNFPHVRPAPMIVNIFEHFKLYRCMDCKAYWEKCVRSARIIKESTAYQKF
jgi:hypothetical protein